MHSFITSLLPSLSASLPSSLVLGIELRPDTCQLSTLPLNYTPASQYNPSFTHYWLLATQTFHSVRIPFYLTASSRLHLDEPCMASTVSQRPFSYWPTCDGRE